MAKGRRRWGDEFVLPAAMAGLLRAPPKRTVPSEQALADMIAREYPGLLDE